MGTPARPSLRRHAPLLAGNLNAIRNGNQALLKKYLRKETPRKKAFPYLLSHARTPHPTAPAARCKNRKRPAGGESPPGAGKQTAALLFCRPARQNRQFALLYYYQITNSLYCGKRSLSPPQPCRGQGRPLENTANTAARSTAPHAGAGPFTLLQRTPSPRRGRPIRQYRCLRRPPSPNRHSCRCRRAARPGPPRRRAERPPPRRFPNQGNR